MYVPVFDPDVHTNGTKRAPVLRVDVLEDPDIFKKHTIKSDPFNEEFDMMDDNSTVLFLEMMTKACEGKHFCWLSAIFMWKCCDRFKYYFVS